MASVLGKAFWDLKRTWTGRGAGSSHTKKKKKKKKQGKNFFLNFICTLFFKKFAVLQLKAQEKNYIFKTKLTYYYNLSNNFANKKKS